MAACARRAKAQALKAGDRWRECAAFCDATAAAIGTPISEGMDMASRAACVARALAALDSASVEEDSLPEVWVWALRRDEAPDEACDAARSRADRALKAVATASTEGAPRGARLRCDEALNRASKARRAKTRADDAYARGHYRAAAAMYRDALRVGRVLGGGWTKSAFSACALVLEVGEAVGRQCINQIVEAAVLNHGLHAIAAPARWRGFGVGQIGEAVDRSTRVRKHYG